MSNHEDCENPDKKTAVCDQAGGLAALCRAAAPVSVGETPEGEFWY